VSLSLRQCPLLGRNSKFAEPLASFCFVRELTPRTRLAGPLAAL